MWRGPALAPRVLVSAHGAVLAAHRSGLASLGARAQVRNVSRYLERHDLPVRQYEVGGLAARPHERESVLHATHTDRDGVGSAV
eukprot:6514428-Alexandrium_andersonii.AAC.1